jgi:CheY-like chemotaxis protein
MRGSGEHGSSGCKSRDRTEVGPMARRCRVPIVEDDKEIRNLLRNALSLEGYEGTTTSITSRELDNATLSSYDIVIIDFASTGDAGHAAHRSHPQRGGVGHAYVMKPVSVSGISELIRETLDQTRAECEPPPGRSSRLADGRSGHLAEPPIDRTQQFLCPHRLH